MTWDELKRFIRFASNTPPMQGQPGGPPTGSKKNSFADFLAFVSVPPEDYQEVEAKRSAAALLKEQEINRKRAEELQTLAFHNQKLQVRNATTDLDATNTLIKKAVKEGVLLPELSQISIPRALIGIEAAKQEALNKIELEKTRLANLQKVDYFKAAAKARDKRLNDRLRARQAGSKNGAGTP